MHDYDEDTTNVMGFEPAPDLDPFEWEDEPTRPMERDTVDLRPVADRMEVRR